jgi:hypothetical protein
MRIPERYGKLREKVVVDANSGEEEEKGWKLTTWLLTTNGSITTVARMMTAQNNRWLRSGDGDNEMEYGTTMAMNRMPPEETNPCNTRWNTTGKRSVVIRITQTNKFHRL